MPRASLPRVQHEQLVLDTATSLTTISLTAPDWYTWLNAPQTRGFAYATDQGLVTVRRETRFGGWYWYAYRRQDGKLRKAYLGKAADLTPERLRSAVTRLLGDGTRVLPRDRVTLQILGTPEVMVRGDRVELSVKAFALLAYLALEEIVRSREQIMALLWPESGSTAARKNLRNVLWGVRRALGDDVIVVTGNQLRLSSDTIVDAHVLQQTARQLDRTPPDALASVLAQHGQPLLDGFVVEAAPEFELWLLAERERLQRDLRTIVTALLAVYHDQQAWQQLIAAAQHALPSDPLHEPLYQALMEAYARMGDRVEALRTYEHLRSTLDRELGTTPLPATETLRQAIVRGAFQPAQPMLSLPATFFRRAAERNGPPFVGRVRERALLDETWTRVLQQQAHVVLLSGDVGIGKTRLWHEWARSLGDDVVVLESEALETTQMVPFGPLHRIFTAIATHVATTRSEQPAPDWLTTIARLVPQAQALLPTLPALAPLAHETERQQVFEALVQLLGSFGPRPLIFVLDNAQWADHATLDWLDYLVGRMHDAAFMLVLAYRVIEAPPALVHLTARWLRTAIAQRLPLDGLSQTEVAALLASLSPHTHCMAPISASSGGNPYFLLEFARAAPGELPPALRDLLHARIMRLDEKVRQVLHAVMVLQPHATFDRLLHVTGRDEDVLLDTLDTLAQGELVLEQNATFVIQHPLIATVVDSALHGARRVVLHRRAAEAIEATSEDARPALAADLARHYQEAGQAARAAAYAQQAADHALTLAAPVEAIQFYRQALALDPMADRWVNLGWALTWQGDLTAAHDAFQTAHRLAAAQGEARVLTDACLGHARTLFAVGRYSEAVEVTEQGLATVDAAQHPALGALGHLLLGVAHRARGHAFDTAAAHLVQALELACAHHLPRIAIESQFELGNVRAQQGDLAGALAAFRAVVGLAQQVGDHLFEVEGHNNVAYHALLLGDLPAAHAHIAAGLELAERYDLELPRQWLYSTRGEIALAEEQWAEAEMWLSRALAAAEQYQNTEQIAISYANLAAAARGSGATDEAVLLLERARTVAASATLPYVQTQIDLWQAELYLARMERASAGEALRRAYTRMQDRDYGRLAAWAERLAQEVRGNAADHAAVRALPAASTQAD